MGQYGEWVRTYALSLKGVLQLCVLRDHPDAEDHGQENRGSSSTTAKAVPCKRVEIGIGSGVLALARRAEDAGNGASHDEEVKRRAG